MPILHSCYNTCFRRYTYIPLYNVIARWMMKNEMRAFNMYFYVKCIYLSFLYRINFFQYQIYNTRIAFHYQFTKEVSLETTIFDLSFRVQHIHKNLLVNEKLTHKQCYSATISIYYWIDLILKGKTFLWT